MPWGTRLFESLCVSFTVYVAAMCYAYLSRGNAGTINPAMNRSVGPLARALVLGTFEQHAQLATAMSAFVNFAGFLMILDFVYRAQILHPSADLVFQRVGFVTSDAARISVRCMAETALQISFRQQTLPQGVEIGDLPWELGDVSLATVETDYVVTFVLDNLQPDTQYVYRTNASHAGKFYTHPLRPKRWSLISTSCIKSFWPYNPMDHSLSIHGLDFLSRTLQSRDISFVLFLGDFIYIDLPRRFGWSREHYNQAYRQVYASPSWSASLTEIPWLHAYDDHEISNNWSANETGLWREAMGPFTAYHHAANPTPPRPGETYYTFNHGDVSFFVLDTRRYRSPSDVQDEAAKTMLGARQREDLEIWLDTAPGWKVVVSSVPFTRNWRSPDVEDSWGGFLWERERLLQRMWQTHGVLIISGVSLYPVLPRHLRPCTADMHRSLANTGPPRTRNYLLSTSSFSQ